MTTFVGMALTSIFLHVILCSCFLLNYFLVANDDGLYDMEDRCLEALGDKTPLGVEAFDGGIAYVFRIK